MGAALQGHRICYRERTEVYPARYFDEDTPSGLDRTGRPDPGQRHGARGPARLQGLVPGLELARLPGRRKRLASLLEPELARLECSGALAPRPVFAGFLARLEPVGRQRASERPAEPAPERLFAHCPPEHAEPLTLVRFFRLRLAPERGSESERWLLQRG